MDKGFAPKALDLVDGTEVEADVVALATGYDNSKPQSARHLAMVLRIS